MSAPDKLARAEHRTCLLIAGLAGLMPVLAFFSTPALAPLLIVAALAALAVGPRAEIIAAVPRGPAMLSAAFLIWCAASALWALEPGVSLRKFGQLLFLFAAGLVMVGASRIVRRREGQRRAATALVLGIVVTLLLLALESALDAPIADFLTAGRDLGLNLLITRYNRPSTLVAILLVPALAIVAWRYGWRGVLALSIASVAVLSVMHSRTAIAGAVASLCVAAAALRWPTIVHRLVLTGFVIILASPFWIGSLIPSDPTQMTSLREWAIRHQVLSTYHRLRIWEFSAQRMDDRPVLGWGLDSSRSLPGANEPSDAAGERMPLHPHNAAIQLRLELGIPGILLGGALALWPLFQTWRTPTRDRAVILGVSTAAIIVASMSYGIWQSWWVSVLWLFACLVPLALGAHERPDP